MSIIAYRELIATLIWKTVSLRYKQAYLGVFWAILKPLALTCIFSLVRSFVGIDSGGVPYPVLTFAALIPWTFFQESTSEGVYSVVSNTALIKKIYFPREIFPITSVLTKLVELVISLVILAGLMAWYQLMPTAQILWVPVIILYTMFTALAIAFFGAAVNVFYRDAGQALPVFLSLLMYASPVMYPLQLVKEKLINQRAAGEWSELAYTFYTLNPLAGIIDAFQSVVLRGVAPDLSAMLPGAIMVVVVLPLGFLFFKHAESYFADVI